MNMISLENHAQTRTRKSEIRGMTLEKTIRNAIPPSICSYCKFLQPMFFWFVFIAHDSYDSAF